MGNQLNADPFLVQVKEDVNVTDDVLKPVFKLSDEWKSKGSTGNRWYDYNGSWLFMDNLKRHQTKGTTKHPQQDYYLGSVLRARLDELPMQVGRNGVSPLEIPDDEGISDHMAFLWDPTTGLMWLHRERHVGRTAFMQYLRVLAGQSVGIVPVLQDDAPARAKRIKDVKKIEFTYVVSGTAPKPKGFFGFIADLGGYGAAKIEVSVRPSRGEYLDDAARGAVREIAEEVRQGTGAVSKAQVWGDIDDDHKNMFIDLLRQRSDFSTDIGDRQKSRDPHRLMLAVRNIWLTHRAEVTV